MNTNNPLWQPDIGDKVVFDQTVNGLPPHCVEDATEYVVTGYKRKLRFFGADYINNYHVVVVLSNSYHNPETGKKEAAAYALYFLTPVTPSIAS